MMEIGKESILGQARVKEELGQIIARERVSHAYLFTGPVGVGKKALALAFAEALNGVQNLNPAGDYATSTKSSWNKHPDIHVFIPLPSNVTQTELRERLTMLAEDPYAVVDFGLRPALGNETESKNRNAFYSVDYYRDDIRPSMFLKPNEGRYTIVILTGIEKMQEKVANAFLKLLEEPPEDVVFLLVTDNFNQLLPTIVSRCQILRCQALTTDEICEALEKRDGRSKDDAEYLARVSAGNYSLARFYDVDSLRLIRNEIVDFLRASYLMDPKPILDIALKWSTQHHSEGQLQILNLLEIFLRDLLLFRATGDETRITNLDQKDVVAKFVGSLQNARIEEMITEILQGRQLYATNVNSKIWLTVLALRYGALMRGNDTTITDETAWKHLPASIWV